MRLFRKARSTATEVGRPVFTSDSQHIGDVKDVQGTALRIDARMSKDYWLSMRDVQSSTDDRIVLNFTSEELEDYKREERPPDTVPEGITLEREMEARRRALEEPPPGEDDSPSV